MQKQQQINEKVETASAASACQNNPPAESIRSEYMRRESMVFHHMPSVWWSPLLSDTLSVLLSCDQKWTTACWRQRLKLHNVQCETLLKCTPC